MSSRLLRALTLAMTIAVLTSVALLAQGQSQASKGAPAAAAYTPPKTADGQPDLQGTWSYATLTPLERPKELSGKEVLSEREAADFEKETLARRDNDRRDEDPARNRPVNGGVASADVARAYNQFWWDYGTNVIA